MDIYLKDKNVTLHTAKKYCEEDINVNVECDKLSAIPSAEEQTYSGIFDEVKIGPIPEEYLIPEGTINIKENGDVDVSKYASANINIKPDRTPLESKGVDFIDYDGTLLYSYTVEEAQALTELPELPTQKGLICQGWNWTLEDIKEYGRELVVGAMYITDDGKTRIYIDCTLKNITMSLCFRENITNGVEIDWGDGSPIETPPMKNYYTNILVEHQYVNEGSYIITLNPIEGCTLFLGGGGSSYSIMGEYLNQKNSLYNMIKKIELGRNVNELNSYTFRNLASLSSITMPNSINDFGTYVFRNCYSLSAIVIPSNNRELDTGSFYECSLLSRISIPKNLKYIGNSTFQQCYALSSLCIPMGISTLLGIIGQNYALSNIFVPNNITSINGTGFAGCMNVVKYDYSTHAQVPTVSSTSAFGVNDYTIIIVPDELYDEWIIATNWVSVADHIVKKSEVT